MNKAGSSTVPPRWAHSFRNARTAAFAISTLIALLVTLVIAQPVAQAAPPENPKDQGPIQVNLGPGAQPIPEDLNYVWSFVLADANSGEILAMKDPDRKLPQASTLKVLTALTTMPHLDPHSTYYGTKQDEEAEGMKAGVKAGASYSVDDLFHGLLMPSGNDAASAIANANGGWDRTIAAMNAEAQRVGADNTVAKNPSGLDEQGQHSTARDLTTIFRNAMQIPDFVNTMSVKRYEFPGPPVDQSDNNSDRTVRGTYPIWTSNRLLLNDHEGALGGKTGFTSQAGRTFVAATQREGRTLVLSLMRAARSTERLSEQLLTWGFANADKVTPVGSLPEVAPRVPSQSLPAVQLNADGSPKPDQQSAIDDLAVANEGKTVQAAAQTTGSELGSGLLSALFKPVLWLATLMLLVVAVLRLRVMLIAARRGSGNSSARRQVDLRPHDGGAYADDSRSSTQTRDRSSTYQ